ncbi:hypothetical protein GCM10017056_23840 [Seohaeicola zhoushanensis]|uniref:Fenitrothion hydrolase n=1 Tax=Seohaeicola zhoushanensis TaxID=1569283 RepID=A0A8J3GY97_9RHOB|nr:hypothetical protein GCM10017056_23840 [Seohaeicola zhoushanensis]
MTLTQENLFRKRRLAGFVTLIPAKAGAHASEQGLVLLLPTDVYISAGAASVAATVLLLALVPERWLARLFAPLWLGRWRRGHWRVVSSLASFAVLMALLWAGIAGARDPLSNPLPLAVWTVWWIGFTVAVGTLGDLWAWLNPWSGPAAVLRALGLRSSWHLPHRVAPWLALAGFLGFGGFLLADPAPSDPARLARVVGLYWLAAFLGTLAFGPRFLLRAEAFSVFFRAYARLGLFARGRVGLTGWQILRMRAPSVGLAVFMVVLLGSGSFDGLNETFWWLAHIGMNPLEFPGRSAVVFQNLAGLYGANLMLVAAFALVVRLGIVLAGGGIGWAEGFCRFAPTILPIALGYHVAHYLTALLVDGQYALIAGSDPLARGWDLLGLGTFYVTTGFFNTTATVKVIFLTQAGAVIVGHMLSVVLAHAIALRAFPSPRRALLSQLPMAAFMVAYTLFGLWLLASPRGA